MLSDSVLADCQSVQAIGALKLKALMSLSEVADWVKSASGESSQAYRSPRLWETWQGEDSPNGTLRWSDSGNCKSSQKMKALGLTDCQSALAIATLVL